MKRLLVLTALACTLFAAPVNRGLIASVEVAMNKRLEVIAPGEFFLMGHTHGVYLDGYGCVFTTRVNLADGPAPGPFMQQIPEALRSALHKKKLERLPLLRTAMKEMLVSAAGVMDPVQANEKLVLSVSLVRWPHEDTTGLPAQIVMQAQKKTLMGFLMAGTDKAALDAAIQVREF